MTKTCNLDDASLYYFTFNYINLGEGEAYTLGHILNVCLQLSFWQRCELVKQGSNVVSIDRYEYLRTKEKRRCIVINNQPKFNYRVFLCYFRATP